MLNRILNIAKDVFSEYVDVKQIDPDTRFDSLDIDSLLLVEFAVVLNQKLEFLVTEFQIKQANSVRSVKELYESSRHDPLISIAQH